MKWLRTRGQTRNTPQLEISTVNNRQWRSKIFKIFQISTSRSVIFLHTTSLVYTFMTLSNCLSRLDKPALLILTSPRLPTSANPFSYTTMEYTTSEAKESFCDVYDGASVVNFVFSLLITGGIFVSYLPQYYRIYKKQTSEGLSVSFLLLGSCLSIFTFTNIIMISSRARYCCRIGALTLFNCLNSQLNLIQIGLQCTCAIMILVLVIVFTRGSLKQDRDEFKRIIHVGRLVLLHGIALVIQIIVAFTTNRSILLYLAQLNGLMSTLLTVIKYVPQIVTTYNLKHPGTLSIGMMCIQTPGGFVFTATLFFTKGSHWSSWVSYLVAALLQGTLLLLCIYYEYIDKSSSEEEQRAVERIIEENREQPEETTPLV